MLHINLHPPLHHLLQRQYFPLVSVKGALGKNDPAPRAASAPRDLDQAPRPASCSAWRATFWASTPGAFAAEAKAASRCLASMGGWDG